MGGVLGALIFAAAAVAAGRRKVSLRRWLAVALLATVSGATIGLALHMHAVGARTPIELAVVSLYLAIAAATPIFAAAGIVRAQGPASFDRLLKRRGVAGLEKFLTTAFVATSVLALYLAFGLVFDPRYREFATSTLIGPIVGLALASWLSGGREAGLSERLFSVLLGASAVVIVMQERLENYEALSFAAVLLILAGTLWVAPGAQKRAAAAPAPAR
jgi:glucan 1,3-beta-glucosidase